MRFFGFFYLFQEIVRYSPINIVHIQRIYASIHENYFFDKREYSFAVNVKIIKPTE